MGHVHFVSLLLTNSCVFRMGCLSCAQLKEPAEKKCSRRNVTLSVSGSVVLWQMKLSFHVGKLPSTPSVYKPFWIFLL